ncbi:unnamed protein product [Phaedon cochleariae]|uniref:Fibroblast growth factor n=1 Tax=Phaedon cochleariae TaxID=80249 RepID=A0A9N9SBS6_PHACE|nr:unnamed protein product [Phaedon cochleariae]
MASNGKPFANHVRLYSQTGFNLTIRGNGEICGTDDDADNDSKIDILSGGGVSLVRLFGVNSNLYVCFGDDGIIYGEEDPTNEGTIFVEEFQGSYSAFMSNLYAGWYIGIKKNGLPKAGNQTKYGQKAIKFLPRRL